MKQNNRNGGSGCLRQCQEGSALLWSLMILTLLLVLSVASMTMGAAALTKARKEAAFAQAYYTSKGAVDLAADTLFGENTMEPARELMLCVDEAAGRNEDYESCQEEPEDWDPVEGLPVETGECRMRIYYRAQTDALYISACTSIGGCQRVVTLELERESLDQPVEEEQPGEKPAEGADDSRGSVWRSRRYMEADKIGEDARR